MPNNEREIKIIKRARRAAKAPENPLYQTFCYQISAALGVARQISQQAGNDSPAYVKRFLEEFGQKA